jgi:hypothetical protein
VYLWQQNQSLLKTLQPVKKLGLRFGKVLLTGFVVLAVSVAFLYPQLFYCQIVSFSDFSSEKGSVYFSPEIKRVHFSILKNLIAKSEARVDSFYSGRKSDPVFIICSNIEQYEKYCRSTEGAGCSIGTPWGNNYIVLNAQGLNVDVISHEMSHIELLERIGWWKTTFDIPQWFNEGIALMLDRRFVSNPDPADRYFEYMDEWLYYTRGGQEILELEDISTIREFFSGEQRQVMLAYMTAGMEVSYWLARVGDSGFRNFINDMHRGNSFSDAYANVEKASKHAPAVGLPENPLRFEDSKKKSE